MMTSSLPVLTSLKYLAMKIKYRRFLPRNHTVEDIFLVSYPKSGNTWLRFLIANAIKVHYQIEREVNFFSIQDVIPAIKGSTSIRLQGPFGRTDIPRIITSHSFYNPYYYQVILLVRDPRDVIVSYYYFLKNFKIIPDRYPMREFIEHKEYGIEAWLEHTKAWFLTRQPGQLVQLFLYEEFLEKPQEQLARLMNLLGLNLDESSLSKAIELSSKENMKSSAKKHDSTYIVKTSETSFVRQGKATKGQELSDEDRKYIEEKTQDIAKLFGYF